MASAWGKAWGKAWGNAWGSIAVEQGGGRRKRKDVQFVPWSEVKQRADYQPQRPAEKYTVLIDGKSYDPLVSNVQEVLLESVNQPLQGFTELERQSYKLERRFGISNGRKAIEIPLFKPTIAQLPDFQSASIEEFESFAEEVERDVNEERRRIILLLLHS